MRKNGRSVGELISSVTFFVGAIWLGLEANSFYEQDDLWRAIPVSIGAFLSFLASMRFILQNLIQKMGQKND
ncbi:MAG: hypothetical protein CML41_03675 [Rhodobacteraceae bacterium]|nr:hypothetical protein [Paracoccaceae bacterium]